MKLIITATAPELNAPVNPRFGRADFFFVIANHFGSAIW